MRKKAICQTRVTLDEAIIELRISVLMGAEPYRDGLSDVRPSRLEKVISDSSLDFYDYAGHAVPAMQDESVCEI